MLNVDAARRRCMNSRSHPTSLLLLAVALTIAASPAQAQQRDSLQALKRLTLDQLMNIEVTSVSRRAERLAQTASAIQVITQEDIRQSGATSLPEALRLAANLQVAQVDSRQWAISARGFNGTTANKLLVLIDGRTIYTPLFSGVFWDAQDVVLADIDRIEVISGPGATLWGANAVNGVINVITKEAKDTPGLALVGGGGTELQGFGTARYGGTLGPRTNYRIYGTGVARDRTLLPNGQGAPDDWHIGQGGFRIDWDASASNRLTLQGDLYDGRSNQLRPGDVTLSGKNVIAKWAHTISANSDVGAQMYYDRTHRDIPGTFGEDLDIYDVDLQQRALLPRHEDRAQRLHGIRDPAERPLELDAQSVRHSVGGDFAGGAHAVAHRPRALRARSTALLSGGRTELPLRRRTGI